MKVNGIQVPDEVTNELSAAQGLDGRTHDGMPGVRP